MAEIDVEFRGVSFTYIGSQEPALKDINFSVKQGELLMVMGPSGAGKTTLCCCIDGLVPHFYNGDLKGDVTVRGMNTAAETVGALSRHVGMLFQDPQSQLVSPTVADEIAFGPENLAISREEIGKRIDQCLDFMRLRGYEERNPATLSGGEQQACALASIVSMRPEVYVLDEPTSNLDPIGSNMVLSAITDLARAEKKTMIIVEHKIEQLANIVDRMLVMDAGRVVLEGEPRRVLRETELLEQIGLKPPQATVVCNRLGRKFEANFGTPLTLDEAYQKLAKFLKERKARKAPPQNFQEQTKRTEPLIQAEGLWHIYPAGVEALKDLNLQVFRGDFLAIIGQNGSGKTTLVKHFNGLLKPTRGRVLVLGKDTATQTTAQLSHYVGMVFQNPDHQLVKFKVREEVGFGPRNLGVPEEEIETRTLRALDEVGLKHVIERDPHELGKGEKQRVALASALAMKPEIFVIDEPTTGQDFKRARDIMNLATRLNNEGSTIIVITHDMTLVAEYANRAVVMHKGEMIYDGHPRDLFAKTTLLEKTYLSPPQITSLGALLGDYVPYTVLTTEEMAEVLSRSVI